MAEAQTFPTVRELLSSIPVRGPALGEADSGRLFVKLLIATAIERQAVRAPETAATPAPQQVG